MQSRRFLCPLTGEQTGVKLMTICVVFASQYGHTAAIAAQIALGCDAPHYSLGDLQAAERSARSDVVVLLCPIYAGRLIGAASFLRMASARTRVVGVTVGASDPDDPRVAEQRAVATRRVTPVGMRERVEWFHVRGGIDYPRLGFAHRQVMRMLYAKAKRDAAAGGASAQEFVALYGKTVEFDNRDACRQIIDRVRTLDRADHT